MKTRNHPHFGRHSNVKNKTDSETKIVFLVIFYLNLQMMKLMLWYHKM